MLRPAALQSCFALPCRISPPHKADRVSQDLPKSIPLAKQHKHGFSIPLTKTPLHSPSTQCIVRSRRIWGMRPCRASRRVLRELGKMHSFPACICITFLQFRSLREQNLSSCPAYSFPSCPSPCTQESLPSQLASLHAIMAPRGRSRIP